MKSNIIKIQSGNTLVESLLALAFAIVIITAVVIAVITAVSNSTFTKNQNLASQFAQQGIDIARYMKTSNYTSFRALPSGGEYCPTQTGQLAVSENCVNGEFSTVVFVDHGTGAVGGRDQNGVSRCQVGSSFVASVVSWTDGKCTNGDFCHKVQLDTCLSDLDQLDNP